MSMKRPMLDTAGQIRHLREKGVLFTIMSEDQAIHYLEQNNNFFKLTSYRKNYEQNEAGKYVHLEFAYLVDLAIIDMRLRYVLLHMCLDVEHFARIRLIKTVEENKDVFPGEDGYAVVDAFKAENPDNVQKIYSGAKKSPYCADLIQKYEEKMPVWAFVEMLQFGDLTRFYFFVAKRFQDRNMKKELYMMQEIRKLRNACAHSNCILNDLRSDANSEALENTNLSNALSEIGISRDVRRRKMSNTRIRQIVTLLYFSHAFVLSDGVKRRQAKQLHEITDSRILKNQSYYAHSDQYLSFCKLLKTIVDNWYPL